MSEEKHPSDMNLLQLYMRTTKLAKTTSRMKSKAWYQDALELEVQVHCYLQNEGDLECFLYLKSKNSYVKIEGLSQRQLQMADELEKFVNRVLECDGAAKAKSLGVVFYLADELSIAGLGPEHQNPVEINNLRGLMIEDPTEVLDDKTVSSETHSWRLFPYPGAPAGNEFATAVAVSRKHDEALKVLRGIGNARNLPIRTTALSAPLCAIASLPWYTTAKDTGAIGVFNYETFTVLSFYNKHADLMMVRFMPHPSNTKYPANIGPAVMASATAFELESPEINVLSMVGHDVESMIVSLQSSMMGSEILLISIEEILKEKSLAADTPIEMLVATMDLDPEVYPMAENATFTSFKEEGWHLQDFLAASQVELDMHPSREDMKLLSIGRKVKAVAALLLIGVLAYSGLSTWNKLRDPAWTYKKQDTQSSALALKTELKRYQHWNNMLIDRSKAWTSMELVSQLIPSDGSVILKDVKHRVDQKPEKKAKKYGFKKSWNINGFTNDKGQRYLETISTREGIKKVFKDAAIASGSQAYLPDVGQRDITVKMVQRSNPTYNTVSPAKPSDRYRLAFTMTITQTFNAVDELALAGVKEKKKR
ncbi:MAG: hypothetical protein AB8F34_06600 [Akkermansiaceae bacterium]